MPISVLSRNSLDSRLAGATYRLHSWEGPVDSSQLQVILVRFQVFPIPVGIYLTSNFDASIRVSAEFWWIKLLRASTESDCASSLTKPPECHRTLTQLSIGLQEGLHTFLITRIFYWHGFRYSEATSLRSPRLLLHLPLSLWSFGCTSHSNRRLIACVGLLGCALVTSVGTILEIGISLYGIAMAYWLGAQSSSATLCFWVSENARYSGYMTALVSVQGKQLVLTSMAGLLSTELS